MELALSKSKSHKPKLSKSSSNKHKYRSSKKLKFNKKRLLLCFGIILVVLLAALGAYSLLSRQSARPVAKQPISHSKVRVQPPTGQKNNNNQQSSGVTPATGLSNDWHITVYYTPVEKYHNGPSQEVSGCLVRECSNGNSPLGSYPEDFVTKVKNEGAGLISTGDFAGKYLNWSYDVGYWLDTIPSDSYGNPLQPFMVAAADPVAMARGTKFKLNDCGSDPNAITSDYCNKLKSSTWVINDQFTPGLGGPKHVDLYIGEENQPNFESSDLYVDLNKVTLQVL